MQRFKGGGATLKKVATTQGCIAVAHFYHFGIVCFLNSVVYRQT